MCSCVNDLLYSLHCRIFPSFCFASPTPGGNNRDDVFYKNSMFELFIPFATL